MRTFLPTGNSLAVAIANNDTWYTQRRTLKDTLHTRRQFSLGEKKNPKHNSFYDFM